MKPTYMFLILFAIIILFGGLWDKLPAIKELVHVVLDPTFGVLLSWNLYFGMFVIVLLVNVITTLAQKYLTDQETLKKMKDEQKIMQEEAKKYKNDPQKLMDFNKKQLEHIPKTFELTMRPLLYTFIPFIIFFRWFNDFFIEIGNPRFFGFLTWFWFYFILSIALSSILRKVFKVY